MRTPALIRSLVLLVSCALLSRPTNANPEFVTYDIKGTYNYSVAFVGQSAFYFDPWVRGTPFNLRFTFDRNAPILRIQDPNIIYYSQAVPPASIELVLGADRFAGPGLVGTPPAPFLDLNSVLNDFITTRDVFVSGDQLTMPPGWSTTDIGFHQSIYSRLELDYPLDRFANADLYSALVSLENPSGTTFNLQFFTNLSWPDGNVTGDYGYLYFQIDSVTLVPFDGDGDGVPDERDLCLYTLAGAIIDAEGCSIDQLAPCAGPRAGGVWRNHGNYVSEVAQTAADFLAAGLIDETQKGAFVAAAGRSDCGKAR